MAGKRFAVLDITPTDTDLFLMEGVAANTSTVNVRFINRNSATVKVRMALVDDVQADAVANLIDEDHLEWDAEILANQILENTGIVVPAGYSIVVRSNTTGVGVIAYGFEEAD